uniref:Trimethyllysine dioxygenase, mitochondrial n=1 Tax=Anopheles farauti TaxID=69004 RepID=A0A182QT31_9DIPT
MSKLRSCCVPCCKDEKFSLVHKFPSDNERAEQWRRALAIDNFIGLPIDIIRKRYFVCTRHFRDSDYKNKMSRGINVTAVPSINLLTLDNPEGLNRDLHRLPQESAPQLDASGMKEEEPNTIEIVDDEEQHNGRVRYHLKDEPTVSRKSSVISKELSEYNVDTSPYTPFDTELDTTKKVLAPVVESKPVAQTSLKRIILKRANPFEPEPAEGASAAVGGLVKMKVLPATRNTARASIKPTPANLVSVGIGRVPPVVNGTPILKRVTGPPAMLLERKRRMQTSTMTQTDDSMKAEGRTDLWGAEEKPRETATNIDQNNENPVKMTKVLALLECTSDNLQRLQRKLQEQGDGELCLDERLLRGLDELDNNDKEMNSCKTDVTADTTRFLTVRNVRTDETVPVSYVWLRDHCRCDRCYNTVTSQRSTSILDLPLDIQPATCNITKDHINIVWQDGHKSIYDLAMVLDNHAESFRRTLEQHRSEFVLWDRDLITSSEAGYARVTLNDLLCEDDVVQQVVRSLVTYGFAFVTKVPPNQQSTEMAVKRIFPVQRTFFGDMWTFSESKMDHSDTAYTNGYLGPHTDNTYFNDAAGLQVLHCIQFKGTGAETLLVDGFRAAERLRISDPEAFERLCEYPLEAQYIEEDKHHRYVAPVLKRHPVLRDSGAIEQIRFNPDDRAPMRTLAAADVPQFYADYRKLADELYREEAQWKFQLLPGEVVIFDNWRVLHGRMAYTGKRVMTGCYVARTEYQSVARTMGFIA